ncbi:hypothetical protein GWK47_024333 [Chionoecetes opilio]|uniref:Uncharacterized protein n=1 Tax=Chionoecetes opilio TaxID=41210 RepID=A0A8J4XL36_CHIOP|nr:hypothetical protein GWK47_024333 [Chionoecetes opilio]
MSRVGAGESTVISNACPMHSGAISPGAISPATLGPSSYISQIRTETLLPGDDGSCKHVVALMYAVANFVHRNEVSLSIQRPTPTYLLCTWDKPHKSSEPLRIYHTDGRFVHST